MRPVMLLKRKRSKRPWCLLAVWESNQLFRMQEERACREFSTFSRYLPPPARRKVTVAVTRLKQDLRGAGDDRGPKFKVHGKGTRAKAKLPT